MEDVAKEFMIDLGISYEDRSKQSQLKTANRYTKRLNIKNQKNQKYSHRKLLNIILKSNKTTKKNKLEEETILKRKFYKFESNYFISFQVKTVQDILMIGL